MFIYLSTFRCLGLGRPFAIEISNYELLPSQIIQQWSVNDKLAVECNENEPLDLLKLASFVNSTTQGRVFIRDLQVGRGKNVLFFSLDNETLCP